MKKHRVACTMDACVGEELVELLFEPLPPSTALQSDPSWDLGDQLLDEEILQDYYDDSQPVSTIESQGLCDSSRTLHPIARDRYRCSLSLHRAVLTTTEIGLFQV